MNITDQEIYDNRMKWIEYLKRPETKKHSGELEDFDDNESRCCLGHACHIFSPETRYVSGDEVKYGSSAKVPDLGICGMLGLHDDCGSVRSEIPIDTISNHNELTALTELNDGTEATPQEIGAYLESVIMGGDDTPFKKIDVEAPK